MNNDVIKQIKSALDIVDTIKKYVDLARRGQNYIGLCPFHNEKTPSFYVSPNKKIYHCFGCGESGDVLAFLMAYENMSFKEVIAEKAKELNIELKGFGNNSKQNDRVDKIRAVLTLLHSKYVEWLKASTVALKYCDHRGLENTDVSNFGIGYAESVNLQSGWIQSLTQNKQDLLSTGLFNNDMFPLLKNRLIFPIHNAQGVIIGFSGRDLGQDSKAKYINSPESVIFSKKKVLYGMHLAKRSIKSQDRVIIVEGYLDVIAMVRNGFENTVAVMGTALTDFHAKQIGRYTKSVVLMFDNDSAGQNAILKSIPALQSSQLKIEIVKIGEKDPADFFDSHAVHEMEMVLASAQPYMDYFFDIFKAKYNLNNPNEKSDMIADLCSLLKSEKDSVIKEHYINLFSESLNISRNLIQSAIMTDYSVKRPTLNLKTSSKYGKAEELILYFLISNVSARERFLDTVINYLSFFNDEAIVTLFRQESSVDFEMIKKINHSEIEKYLLSLIIKFSERNIEYNEKEMEEYINLIIQNKNNMRINEIKQILGDSTKEESNEKELLLELSELIKNKKRGSYVSNRN